MSSSCARDDRAFRIGRWRVHPALNRITGPDGDAGLEPKAMAVLTHLAARPGEVVSADELIDVIWHNRPMGDNPVYKCIAQLRKALGDDPASPSYIATIPRKGYRLVAPVTPDQAPMQAGRAHHGSARRLANQAGWLALCLVFGVVMVLAYVYTSGDSAAQPGSPPSLAILPFETVSQGDEPAISGTGLAFELSSQLSNASDLRVIAFESSAILDVGRNGTRLAAGHLNADLLLVGKIAMEDERTLLRLDLLDARGKALWSRHYAGRADAIQTTLDEAVRDLALHLGVRLDRNQVTGCAGTTSIEACQWYLLAREHARNQADDFKPRAVELLQQAIAIDPSFAVAQASLATLYLMPGDEFPWPEAYLMAKTAIQRALELDAQLAEAYAANGLLQMTDARGPCPPACFNYQGYAAAEHQLRQALHLKPDFAIAHNWLAIAEAGQGKLAAAHDRLQGALLYDPLNPAINHNLAFYIMQQGEIDTARRQVSTLIDRHPNPPRYMYAALVRINDAVGRYDESLRHARSLVEDPTTSPHLSLMLHAYLQLGLFDEAASLLENYERIPLVEIQLWARQQLPIMRGDLDELADLDRRVMARAGELYGERENWPRWLLKTLGRSQSLLGNHQETVALLQPVYDGPAPAIDHLRFFLEIGTLHALVVSLHALGQDERAQVLLDHSQALIAGRKAEGYDRFPDLTYVEARTWLLQGQRGLAITTLRRAVSQGWRRIWMLEADPRWNTVAGEVDFEQLMSTVHVELAAMRRMVSAERETLIQTDRSER